MPLLGIFLSCAHARKSIQCGCSAFLVIVDEADIASVTEPDVITPLVESYASDEAAYAAYAYFVFSFCCTSSTRTFQRRLLTPP